MQPTDLVADTICRTVELGVIITITGAAIAERFTHIDPSVDQPELARLVEVDPEEPFILHPGKSPLWRLGQINALDGGVHRHGLTGHVALELANAATLPIKLSPGMNIGQLCFFRLAPWAENPKAPAQGDVGSTGVGALGG